MTKKDYIAIAKIISRLSDPVSWPRFQRKEAKELLWEVKQGLVYVFGVDNPRFDAERFIELCEWEGNHDRP